TASALVGLLGRLVRRVGFARVGGLGLGVVSLGVVSLGVVGLGVVGLGVVSLGVVSLGVVSLGVVSLGVVRLGVVSLRVGLLLRSLLGGDGAFLRLFADVLERLVEQVFLALLRLGDLDRLRLRLTLEALPVTGQFQQSENGFGGLSADAEPVARPLTLDLDHGRVVLRMVDANLFDHAPVALLARVDHDDAVVRLTDL